MTKAERSIQQLEQTLRASAPVFRSLERAILSTHQQFFSLDDLMRRYALGRNAVRELLILNKIIIPRRGTPVRVPLRDVLRLDEILREKGG